MGDGGRLDALVEAFLADLVRLGRSPHTVRAYRSDIAAFTRFYSGPPERITAEVIRGYLAGQTGAPATWARRESSLASLMAWAYRTDAIPADPMAKVERTRLPEPVPRGLPAATVEAVFAAIPAARDRDRLLFRFVYTTGMRISEALGIHVDDLDLTLDDEHVTVEIRFVKNIVTLYKYRMKRNADA